MKDDEQPNFALCGDVSEDGEVSWWSQTGSNRRPHACKARALPTELWPHPEAGKPAKLVGPGRLELPTSRLSGVRSNHLSYGPFWNTPEASIARSGLRTLTREYVACEERETKAAKFRMFRAV